MSITRFLNKDTRITQYKDNMKTNKKIHRVVVQVEGGVATAYHVSKGVELCIVDMDNAKEQEDCGEQACEWLSLARSGMPLEECDAKSGYDGWYSV